MKRILYVTLILSVCITTNVSCARKKTDIYALLTELCLMFGESEGTGKGVMYAEKEIPGSNMRFLSSERFGRLYTGKNEPPPCFSIIEGYAIRLSADESGFEIHIIKCVNRSDTAEAANMLASRIESLSSAEIRLYAPSAYMMYFENARVYVNGRYAFLLSTPDNEKCIKLIKDRRLA